MMPSILVLLCRVLVEISNDSSIGFPVLVRTPSIMLSGWGVLGTPSQEPEVAHRVLAGRSKDS